MKRALTSSICLLGILLVVGFTVRPVRADPTVMIQRDPLKPGPMGLPPLTFTFQRTDLNNDNSMAMPNVPEDDFIVNFVNNTGVTLDGLDIRAAMPQAKNITGMDMAGFFGAGPFSGSQSQVVFTVDRFNFSFLGIPQGTAFSIKFSGFTKPTKVTVIPTGVPEPTTMLLLSTGLAGVAISIRKRFKRGEGGHESQ